MLLLPRESSVGEHFADLGHLIHFARTGDPSHERLPEWKPYDANRRVTMLFGRECRPESAPLDQERKLWERWT